MLKRCAIHTSIRRGQWVNTREGSSRAIDGTYDSRLEAVAAGRRVARQEAAEHVSHRPDGSIDEITVAGG